MAVDVATGSINLSIVTPTRSVEETTTEQVTLSGVEGDFGVLPGHAPYFTKLRPGVIYYDEGGMPRQLFATGGFVEVNSERVIVLADKCLLKEDIDKDETEKEKQEAEAKLALLAPDAEERAEVADKLAEASAKLSYITDELDLY